MTEDVKSLVETLDRAVKRVEGGTPAVTSLAKTFETGASVVAWQVAVVSPGFLGLLWNAQTLATHSKLDTAYFSLIFVGAEMLFLLAILASVVMHSFLTETSLTLSMLAATLQGLRATVAGIESGHSLKDGIESFKSLADTHDEIRAKVGVQPWYITVIGKVHGYLTIGGYLLVGVILLAMRLS